MLRSIGKQSGESVESVIWSRSSVIVGDGSCWQWFQVRCRFVTVWSRTKASTSVWRRTALVSPTRTEPTSTSEVHARSHCSNNNLYLKRRVTKGVAFF